mmetsp:Transcript_12467/g.31613  ORF Transcript_12467/g.31613 Transcript_12467/m.31613 type:complete len:194 (+) Transcript_12467:405-986(+)
MAVAHVQGMAEYLDVLDENGNMTGERKLRAHVHRDGDWHRTVHIWIFNADRTQVLVQQRSKAKESWPGLWDVSCAGHVSAGESSLEGALKELEEELGVCPDTDDAGHEQLVFRFAWKNQAVLNDGAYINNEHTDVYTLCLDRPLSSFVLQAEEVEAVRYIPVDRLRFAFSQDPTYVHCDCEEYLAFFDSLMFE